MPWSFRVLTIPLNTIWTPFSFQTFWSIYIYSYTEWENTFAIFELHSCNYISTFAQFLKLFRYPFITNTTKVLTDSTKTYIIQWLNKKDNWDGQNFCRFCHAEASIIRILSIQTLRILCRFKASFCYVNWVSSSYPNLASYPVLPRCSQRSANFLSQCNHGPHAARNRFQYRIPFLIIQAVNIWQRVY